MPFVTQQYILLDGTCIIVLALWCTCLSCVHLMHLTCPSGIVELKVLALCNFVLIYSIPSMTCMMHLYTAEKRSSFLLYQLLMVFGNFVCLIDERII